MYQVHWFYCRKLDEQIKKLTLCQKHRILIGLQTISLAYTGLVQTNLVFGFLTNKLWIRHQILTITLILETIKLGRWKHDIDIYFLRFYETQISDQFL